MINVAYAKRSKLYICSLSHFIPFNSTIIALRAPNQQNTILQLLFCSIQLCSALNCFSLSLSYVSIWNKPAWFMVMWKMPRNGMVWHVSRTNLNTYMHLIVYISCTPTYLFSSIFINIYYENESNSNRMVSHCWLQLMLREKKMHTERNACTSRIYVYTVRLNRVLVLWVGRRSRRRRHRCSHPWWFT